jgi:hypothetical protein
MPAKSELCLPEMIEARARPFTAPHPSLLNPAAGMRAICLRAEVFSNDASGSHNLDRTWFDAGPAARGA